MADIQFTEEQQYGPAPVASSQPALVKLVIRWGLAKDEKSAQYVLLSVTVLAFGIMLWTLFTGLGIGKSVVETRTLDELRAANGYSAPLTVPR